MLKNTRTLASALVALLATVAGFGMSIPPGAPPVPVGVWTHGDTVLLFTIFPPGCKEPAGQPNMLAQTLVSRDGGKSWAWRGPLLDWTIFAQILDTGEEIWIAGDNYDAEGPASRPFVLLVDPDSMDWPQLRIYEGYDELLAVARDDHDGNRLLAWLSHLMTDEEPMKAADDKTSGDEEAFPIFLHESLDRGRTWHVVKQVPSAPKSAPGLHFFQDIPLQSGPWRIANADHPGAFVERRGTDGKWHPASRLPLPVQQKCEE